MYRHILISTDGSDLAQKGVDHGLDLAKAIGAKVTIITVLEPLPALGMNGGFNAAAYEEYTASQIDNANRFLSEIQRKGRAMGIEVETIWRDNGSPAADIVETARTRGCDVIVISSHGRRGLKRLILGSVTAEVLALSHIPVLVVR